MGGQNIGSVALRAPNTEQNQFETFTSNAFQSTAESTDLSIGVTCSPSDPDDFSRFYVDDVGIDEEDS